MLPLHLLGWLKGTRERGKPARLPSLPKLAASGLLSWQAACGHPCTAQIGSRWAVDDAEAGLAGLYVGGSGGAAEPAVALEFPCVLRPAVCPGGLDLQLKLFQLRLGEPWDPASGGRGGSSVSRRRRQAGLQSDDAGGMQPLTGVLDKAVCLLAARLLFPDAVSPVLRLLAAAHCASAATQAAGLLLSPTARASARSRLQRLRGRAPLADAAARSVGQLCRVAHQYGEPAAVLLAVAALWACVHPSSAQIGECIAALVPVMAGYNHTAAQCSTMRLTGDAAEEVWRQRHKWAARRTAALLSELPEHPPLAGLVSACEAVNICVGAVVGGLHFGGLALSDGAMAAGGDVQLWASVGLRSQRARHAEREVLAVVPGHVAAVPADPLSSGSEATSRCSSRAGDRAGADAGPDGEAGGATRHVPGEQQHPGLPRDAALQVQEQQHTGAAAAAGWDSERRQCPAGPAPVGAPAPGADALAQHTAQCARAGGVCDSPSEMCCSPQAPAPASGAGKPVPLDGATEAALRIAAEAAAGSGPAAPGAGDFMHPAHWAEERQRQAGAAAAARGATRSDSTSTVGAASGSVHSFLLPGCRFGSSEASSAGGNWAAGDGGDLPHGGPLLPPGIESAAGAPAQEEQQQGIAGPAAAGSAEVLPLYGQGDHTADAARQLSVQERVQLALRAAHLLALFLPFLLLGSLLLLLASRLDAARARRQPQQQDPDPPPAQQAQQAQQEGAQAEAADDGNGGEPAAVPTASRLRTAAFKLLLSACRRSGAAFIKWGQWASTREDMFPQDFCRVLSELHDQAPFHSDQETRRIVEAAFGAPLESLFLSFETRALASGSVAQVHRARLLLEGRPVEVAVKVRHPGVAHRIWQDFQLLRPLAALTARVRTLRSLNLKDSVAQFSHTMTAQADLRVEAHHLARFYANFSGATSRVHVPRPLEGYCTEDVLVETYEPGRSVSHYIRNPHPQNTQIVALGVDTYLKMLLSDNFVHTDLHPGNILVRSAGGNNHGAAPVGAGNQQGNGQQGDNQQGSGRREQLELVLLDFGLAQELGQHVRHRFISFLHCIARGNGRGAAAHLLHWAERQGCTNPEAFAADMETLFLQRCDIHAEAGIDLDHVIKSVLQLARTHEVSIDSNYAELVLGVCVIVGFAASLDPRLNLMDAATPCFLYHTLTGRVSGRLYM